MLISLKFVISDRLPKISYLTVLDEYLIFSYLMMLALVAHTCMQAQLKAIVDAVVINSESGSLYFYSKFLALLKYLLDLPEQYFLGLCVAVWAGVHVQILYFNYFNNSYYKSVSKTG